MLMIILESGLRQGLLLIPLAFGVHIAFRLLRFPDLTPDGSIILGSALCTTLAVRGEGPVTALMASAIVGGSLGIVTSIFSEVLKLDRILAGIASSLIAYTVVLRVLGRGNLALPVSQPTLYTVGVSDLVMTILVDSMLLLVVASIAQSRLGLRLRAVGENEELVRQLGGQVRIRIAAGLFWANACVGLCGGLLAQHQRFTDVGQGAGTLFVGLACVLVGGAIPSRDRLLLSIAGSGVGAVVYSLLIAAALRGGLHPGDLRGLTAILVISTTVLTQKLFKAERLPLFG